MNEKTAMIMPEEIDRLVRLAISGFGRLGIPRAQAALERAIRECHECGETYLAAALVEIHCARHDPPETLNRILGLLIQDHCNRLAGRESRN